jgi:drug/metabolite transporter (DMT)-like permease
VASFFALLAAVAFAVGAVLQQRGALSTAAPEGDPRFLVQLPRQPMWLIGGSCQALGWVLQAVALDRGSLAVVQSICALSIVFALPLGARLTDQAVGARSVIGALLTLGGIILFLVEGQTEAGIENPPASAWWTASLGVVAAGVFIALLARRRSGPGSAALFATAAGFVFAYQAAVTKVFVNEVGNGLGGILTTWSTYALIGSALAGFALQQSALKTGFLAPAMAASNAATLVISVLLGATIFEEQLVGANGRFLPVVVGLTMAVVGILVLAAPRSELDTGPVDDTKPPRAARP